MNIVKQPRYSRSGQQEYNLAVMAFTDIDGVVNNELVPENRRMETIETARSAIRIMQDAGIPVSLISGRSSGEVARYQKALETQGPAIAEDGGVIMLNNDGKIALPPNALRKLHQGKEVLLLSDITSAELQAFIDRVREQIDPYIMSSCTSSTEDIQRLLKHATPEDAELSMDRLTTAYLIAEDNDAQTYSSIRKLASQYGLKTYGTPLHLISQNINKARAVYYLDENPEILGRFSQEVHGILPIVFGNSENDIELFATAERLGGIAILIAHPDGTYFIPTDNLSPTITKTSAPYGYGMIEALKTLQAKLKSDYSIHLAFN